MGFKISGASLYAIDARPNIGDGAVFDLNVKSDADEEVSLTYTRNEAFEGFKMALVDTQNTDLIMIEAGSLITLKPQGTESQYQLIIGTASFIEAQKQQILPKELTLRPNYPNPFAEATTIEYALPEEEWVELQVFDVLGRSIVTLVNGSHEPGQHRVVWDGQDQNGLKVGAGLYMVQLQAGNSGKKVMTLVKVSQ